MANKVIKALQVIIKEEVRKQVTKELKRILESKKKVSKTKKMPQPSYIAEAERLIQDDIELVDETPKNLAKDPVLNKVLNETKGGIPKDSSIPTLGGGTMTTQNMGQLAGGSVPMQQDPNMPDFMKKAMSGHSAKVVKAVNKKAGQNRNR